MENDIFKLQMHECLGFLPSSIDGTSTDYISIMRVPIVSVLFLSVGGAKINLKN